MTQEQKLWVGGGISVAVIVLLFYFLEPVLAPFFIAALFAYLGTPLVKRLTALKVPHTLAAFIVFSAIMLGALALMLFLIPLLSHQVETLVQQLPVWMAWVQQFVLPWLNQHFGITLSFHLQDLKNALLQNWQQASNVAAAVWKTLATSWVTVIGWTIKLALIPIVTFYLLRDWDKAAIQLRYLLPRRIEPAVVSLVNECNNMLGAFFHGQLLVMAALAIFYSFGLWIIGLDLALLLGSVTGLLAFIPYFGYTVGLIAAAIATFVQFHDWPHIGYVFILFALGYGIENFVLVPLLVGNRIRMHPVVVIFAVLAGGHLFGFVGVLIALPVAAVIMVLLRHLKRHYISTPFYHHSQTK